MIYGNISSINISSGSISISIKVNMVLLDTFTDNNIYNYRLYICNYHNILFLKVPRKRREEKFSSDEMLAAHKCDDEPYNPAKQICCDIIIYTKLPGT